MSNEEKKGSEKFSAFMKKAAEVGKKTAGTVAQGAKDLSEKIKEDQAERERLKKEKEKESLTPLFFKEYKKKDFRIPEIVVIEDDTTHADFWEDAMGWFEKKGEVEVLCLYRSSAVKSGLNFTAEPIVGEVYYTDRFDRTCLIRAEEVFQRAHNERQAELERIAYDLGATSYSIELVEAEALAEKKSGALGASIGKTGAKTSVDNSAARANQRSGRTAAKLTGHNEPTRPALKWFAQDGNINNLIDMRCSSKNAIQSRTLEINGSSMISMSNKVACAIDAIKGVKASASMAQEATKEHNSTLIFEIEF